MSPCVHPSCFQAAGQELRGVPSKGAGRWEAVSRVGKQIIVDAHRINRINKNLANSVMSALECL